MIREPCYKIGKVTGRKYDIFNTVRILNISQAIWYMKHDIPLEDLLISEDRKTGNPVFVFVFDKDKSRPVYEDWCKQGY